MKNKKKFEVSKSMIDAIVFYSLLVILGYIGYFTSYIYSGCGIIAYSIYRLAGEIRDISLEFSPENVIEEHVQDTREI